MEVHHHPDLHHKAKKWKEYLLEFLMIFLAVTLGFFAESFREHILDKEKEKQSIESIIKSIASDTVQLINIESANKRALMYMDKLLELKDSDITMPEAKIKFYSNISKGVYYDIYFRSNDAAFQQLQSTGSLRLIKNQHITDSLFQYQQYTSLILRQESDHYFFTKNVWNEVSELIDVTFLRDTKNKIDMTSNSVVIQPVGKNLLLNYDKKALDVLYNNVAALAATTGGYMILIHLQLLYGRNLIGLLKNEYHIE
jgi:hypothetical protein